MVDPRGKGTFFLERFGAIAGNDAPWKGSSVRFWTSHTRRSRSSGVAGRDNGAVRIAGERTLFLQPLEPQFQRREVLASRSWSSREMRLRSVSSALLSFRNTNLRASSDWCRRAISDSRAAVGGRQFGGALPDAGLELAVGFTQGLLGLLGVPARGVGLLG